MGVDRGKIKAILIKIGLGKALKALILIKAHPWFQWILGTPKGPPTSGHIYDAWMKSQSYQLALDAKDTGHVKDPILNAETLKIVFLQPRCLSKHRDLAQDLDWIVTSCIQQIHRSWSLVLYVPSPPRGLRRKVHLWQAKGVPISLISVPLPFEGAFEVRTFLGTTQDQYLVFVNDHMCWAPTALAEIVESFKQGAELVYCDQDLYDPKKDVFFDPIFKPDWSPDTFRSFNYIGSSFGIKASLLLDRVPMFQDFDDLLFKLTEHANHIVHIPKVLAHVLGSPKKGSDGDFSKILPLIPGRDQNLLNQHLQRVHHGAEATRDKEWPIFKVAYPLRSKPLVSILIPNNNHLIDLRRCVESIFALTTYPALEVLIVENGSIDPEVFDYYKHLETTEPRVRVLLWSHSFNYSAVNNFAVTHARGEQLLFLNNDIEVITPSWIEELMMHSQRPDIGIVGAKLYYPNETVQHAGVIIGMRGLAAHVSRTAPKNEPGYCYRLKAVQNLTAVTAACCMIKKSLFESIGGFDEKLIIAFNDIDLCLKVRATGKLNIFTPYAELFHYESLSRGDDDTPEKRMRFQGEVQHFFGKWDSVIKRGDPYYNANLSLENEEIKLRT